MMQLPQSENHTLRNRREFSQAALALGAAGLVASEMASTSSAEHHSSTTLIKAGDIVLFQGDSITDVGRDRKSASTPNWQVPLGNGYAWLAAATLLVDHPDKNLKIYNRGISGNKVGQLAARWQSDCLDIKPDVLSILIGVNDIWHGIAGTYNGSAESYERDYHALVKQTREALPNVKLVVCEPFVLRCGSVTDKWFPDFDGYRTAARRVANKAGARFVPFQSMFDRAIEHAPPEHWAGDGVHPSQAGAALMAHAWLQTVTGAH